MFLQEQGIRDYENLVNKATDNNGKFQSLSSAIREKEARLAEIAELKTHIINYIKTNDIYQAYKKSGYSKAYLEDHREEILLHKAAKEAFDRLHVTHLPSIKQLTEEYDSILAEKRQLYTEYKKTKKDMMDFQIAKTNVDRFLQLDPETQQQPRIQRDHTTL